MSISFTPHNCLTNIQTLFQFSGIKQITPSSVIRVMFVVMLFTMTACNSGLTPTPTKPVPIVPTQLAALLFGELVVVDNCLRVGDRDSDTSYLLAWPPDFTINMEKDIITIINEENDETVLHIGEMVRFSGGEVHAIDYLDKRTRQKLPTSCPGPYWVVGNEFSSVK